MPRPIRANALVALLAITTLSATASAELTTGEPAPPLEIETLLQAPSDAQATWPALKGKIVVLEFWATWCGPCIGAIPHMNKLADEFKDQPLQFIAVTDEDAKTVKPFLKKRPIHAWIGLDTDKSMRKAYGITGIPTTVIVDRDGQLLGVTSPHRLTSTLLKQVLAGERPKLPRNRGGIRAGQLPDSTTDQPPLFAVLIQHSTRANGGASVSGGGRLTMVGQALQQIIQQAYGVRSPYVVMNDEQSDVRYDVVVSLPHGKDAQLKSMLQLALKTTFDVETHREKRLIDVYVLTVDKQAGSKLTASDAPGGMSASSGGGKLTLRKSPSRMIAANLEGPLARPVIDQTGLKGRYDLDLQWTAGDHNALIQALHSQYGLVLTPTKRETDLLIVDKAKHPK